MARWTKQPGEKNIYFRETGGEKTFMLRTTYNGKRKDEGMAGKTLAEVKEVQAILTANAERGVPPFFYKDLQNLVQEHQQEQVIKRNIERRELIQAEKFRLNHTVSGFREQTYWPERLANTKLSAHENKVIQGRWSNFLKPFFGQIPLQDLQKPHFIEFVKQMREMQQPNGKPYSETTIHKMIADMRQLWSVAQEHSIVSGIFPGKSVIKNIVIDNEKKCFLEPVEVEQLLAVLYEKRTINRVYHDTYCYTVISLFLGLRAGDIHKLNWQDVERNYIDTTKSKRGRFVNFNLEPIQIMLNERRTLYPPIAPTDLVFPTEVGTQRKEVPHRFFEIIKELGFNEVSKRKGNAKETIDFHALRHTYATYQAVAGVDHVRLMKLMGHEKTDMTLRYIEIADNIKAEDSMKILDVMPALPSSNVIVRKSIK